MDDIYVDFGRIEEQAREAITLYKEGQARFDRIEAALKTVADSAVKTIEVKIAKLPEVEVEGKPHPRLDRVLKLAANRINVLLVGPAGCGKTFLAGQVAKCLNLDFSFISCSAGMSEGHLLGRLLPTGEKGRFEYQRSEFVKCYEEGGVFLFDEVDAADPNTLLILNTCLANGHLAVPNRASNPVAIKHKDFVCIAAANTFGTGADRQYVGRNQLDEAFLDRFRMGQTTLDYDAAIERLLCPDELLRTRLLAYRANVGRTKLRRVVSSRFMKDAYIALQAGLTDQEIDEALFSGWRDDEVAKAKEGVHIIDRNASKAPEQPTVAKQHEESNGHHIEEENIVGEGEGEQSPPPVPAGESAPMCPKGHGKMVRMTTGKGFRCNAFGNKYKNGRWTVCDHCVWDRPKAPKYARR